MHKDFIKINWFTFPIFLILLVLSSCVDSGQKEIDYRKDYSSSDKSEYPNRNITDGPYVFYENEETVLKWIEGENLVEQIITKDNFEVIEDNFGIKLKPEWIFNERPQVDYKQEFQNVDRIIAISDIHGQYDLLVKLLREYNIVDEDNNWCFGKGNLIIVGDIFDRGPQVNEALWLVFKLEHQAMESGGKLHYLMGNHEVMIINKDFRYVNEKYMATAEKMDLTYDQLYSEESVLGQWLRSKPVIIQINDVLFVHAGISPEFVEKGFTSDQVNEVFLTKMFGKTKDEIHQDSVLNFLEGRNGPIWYRGYFNDEDLTRVQVDMILKYFNKNYIVVGHTSQESIVSLFRNKIFGIDASIKNGKYGEVLIIDKGDFFRGTVMMTPELTSRDRSGDQ